VTGELHQYYQVVRQSNGYRAEENVNLSETPDCEVTGSACGLHTLYMAQANPRCRRVLLETVLTPQVDRCFRDTVRLITSPWRALLFVPFLLDSSELAYGTITLRGRPPRGAEERLWMSRSLVYGF